MSRSLSLSAILALAVLASLSLMAAPAKSEPPQGTPQDTAQGRQLAELFTSQGCSSCPPAEALFARLAQDPDLVTIEWHVDYWDQLRYGGSRWQDPFSSPDFTARQRAYNKALRGTASVYTPQAILGGKAEFVGSRAGDMKAARARAAAPSLRLATCPGSLSVSGEGRGDVYFVRLLTQHETNVRGGENKGRQLKGRNVALGMEKLGQYSGTPNNYALPVLKPGESCALFVQAPGHGAILGAAYCPAYP